METVIQKEGNAAIKKSLYWMKRALSLDSLVNQSGSTFIQTSQSTRSVQISQTEAAISRFLRSLVPAKITDILLGIAKDKVCVIKIG